MMKLASLRFVIVVTIALLSLRIGVQDTAHEMKSFEKDGVSFNFPSDWMLTDKSDGQKQNLILMPRDASILIGITAYSDSISSWKEFQAVRREFTEPYIDSLAKSFGSSSQPAKLETSCTELGFFKRLPGTLIQGSYQNEQSTAEVYALVAGGRFINLVYIKANKETANGNLAWETIRKTLRINGPITVSSPGSSLRDTFSGGVLNGKALSMPRPDYPAMARSAHAAGTVIVQMTIDETGNVISAQAVTGHPLLKGTAVEAARRARFTPTLLCGEPVKVTGVITYNFVSP
jgi:TonB family protein